MAGYVIGLVLVLSLILVGMLIPPRACYEIWPHQRRLGKLGCNERDEDA
jgi:hypothetical protein